jgi:hypothetical protein
VRGRPLKNEPQDGGVRRQFEWTELGTKPVAGAPPLPRIAGRRWLAVTRSWYRDWCRSPQASLFIATDWNALHRLALLVDEFWRGELRHAGEIRQLESKLGATVDDRMRLRLRVQLRGGVDQAADDKPAAAPARSGQRRRSDPRLALVESQV